MILVVGAGIAGLSLAYFLQERGAPVTVLDRGRIAGGASGVATSYLEPRPGFGPTRAIEWESLRRWPDLVRGIESASGLRCGFKSDGQIRVAFFEEMEAFDKDIGLRQDQGWSVEPIDERQLRAREPLLSPAIASAVHLPQVCWLNGQILCEALARVVRSRGGMVLEDWCVSRIRETAGGVELTSEAGAIVEGEIVAICHGPGQVPIDGLPDDLVPMSPVRGVNVFFDMTNMGKPLRHLVKHSKGSLCPRGDILIVGTTYERGLTSMTPEPDVVHAIVHDAQKVLPVLGDMPVLGAVAGLRSKAGDGNLHLGRSRNMPRVFFSLGHAGAGFLRAPVIADELAQFILTGETSPLTAPFTMV